MVWQYPKYIYVHIQWKVDLQKLVAYWHTRTFKILPPCDPLSELDINKIKAPTVTYQFTFIYMARIIWSCKIFTSVKVFTFNCTHIITFHSWFNYATLKTHEDTNDKIIKWMIQILFTARYSKKFQKTHFSSMSL